MSKPHYFNEGDEKEARNDGMLRVCKAQGYVPETCLLGGQLVFHLVNEGLDPCKGCEGPRERCKGRPK